MADDLACGFCVEKKPAANLNIGWKEWGICDDCVESLVRTRAAMNRVYRERLIGELQATEDWKPEGPVS
jgi:hypothetical protein